MSRSPQVSSVATENRSPQTRVGVIGGGQLAWMMAAGAKALDLQLIVQTPSLTDPAVAIAAGVVQAPVADAAATAQLATQCDVITFENEFIDLAALTDLEQQGVCFRPRLGALQPLLDKYDQRRYCAAIGLPTPRFITLEQATDRDRLDQFLEQLSTAPTSATPLVMKTRRLGYDGQGTYILPDRKTLLRTWEGIDYAPVIVEEFVPFDCELAVMVARSPQGETAVYPIVKTVQVDQVCRQVFVPSGLAPELEQTAQEMAVRLVTELDVVGVFGLELFLTRDRRILINEVAPRTHNSGHYTLDACITSQFEQQLRAVTDQPLGATQLTCAAAVMVNLLGFETATQDYESVRHQLAAIPGAQVYWYNKTASRPGRKLGHVTVCVDRDRAHDLAAIAQQIEAIWYP